MQDTALSNITCQVVYIRGQWLLGLVGEMVSRKRKKCHRKAVIEIPGEIGAKMSERDLSPLIICFLMSVK